MADKNHPHATRTFRYHGFVVVSDPTTKYVEEPARADIKALGYGRGVCIEVKSGNDNGKHSGYELNQWRENQREWADMVREEPFELPYWLYITIGAHPANYNREKYQPERSWLVPTEVYYATEKRLAPYQATLPYKARKGLNKDIQRLQLDAVTLWSLYELKYYSKGQLVMPAWYRYNNGDKDPEEGEEKTNPKGMWIIPQTHLFWMTLL